jgi:hypothetical protein
VNNTPVIPRKETKMWYLFPTFLGIIGGIVILIALRNRDWRKAKLGLIQGIVITFVPIMILPMYAFTTGMVSLLATIIPAIGFTVYVFVKG